MNANQFESLFKEYYQELGRYAMKFLRCSDLSADTVQGVFIKIWEKRDNIGEVNSWKSYLYFSVRNACVDLLRKRKNDVEIEDTLFLKVDADSTDNSFNAGEIGYYIEQALKQLPEKCYTIFSLKKFDGLSNAQVAEELNISVKTQFTIALKKLREHLAQYGLP